MTAPEAHLVVLDRPRLEAHLADLVALETGELGATWGPENFRHELPEKWRHSRALQVGERLRAFAVASRRAPDTVHLHRIVVAEELRGGGHGGRLLAALCRSATEAGAGRLTLYVAEANLGAQRFYDRAGGRRVGTHPEAGFEYELALG